MTRGHAVVEHINAVEDRMLDALRSPAASGVSSEQPTGMLEAFRGRRTCVLVTYKRDGTAVPSPVWFGEHDGKLYVRTGGWKVRRIAHNPAVRVAPSTFRGRPLAPPIEATARILPLPDRTIAATACRANFGLVQRLYHSTLGRTQRGISEYIEITPAAR